MKSNNHAIAATVPTPLAEISAAERARVVAAVRGGSADLRMTYDEFLAWVDEDAQAEWIDGCVLMASPASIRHQLLADFLVKVLGTYVEVWRLGVVVSAPFQMKLENGREPDLLFVAEEHHDRLRATFLAGPADLVIEIVSPESRTRDRVDKFYEYERGGIAEYWLIDPDTRRAEFFRVAASGRYEPALLDSDGIYRAAAVPGFWLRVAWLWQEPLPPLLDVLRELGLA
jgi:Uma2 family endonuclease